MLLPAAVYIRKTVFDLILYKNAFFICLHKQSSSMHPINMYQVVQMFEKYEVKINGCSYQQVLGKNLDGFCLSTGKRFLLEVSF